MNIYIYILTANRACKEGLQGEELALITFLSDQRFKAKIYKLTWLHLEAFLIFKLFHGVKLLAKQYIYKYITSPSLTPFYFSSPNTIRSL